MNMQQIPTSHRKILIRRIKILEKGNTHIQVQHGRTTFEAANKNTCIMEARFAPDACSVSFVCSQQNAHLQYLENIDTTIKVQN